MPEVGNNASATPRLLAAGVRDMGGSDDARMSAPHTAVVPDTWRPRQRPPSPSRHRSPWSPKATIVNWDVPGRQAGDHECGRRN